MLSTSGRPSVSIHWNLGTELWELRDVVRIMVANRAKPDGTLLILARYKHDLPDVRLLRELGAIWKPGTINLATTIHAAKGMQADYVLVTDLVAGKLGFPNEIVDDSILDLVLSVPEQYPNAEERRLFYVALTRAKREAHVVTAESAPSTFAEELRSERYPVEHYAPYRCLRCPKCEIGIIKKRTTGRYSCTNLDECGYTAPVCPACEEGFLLANSDPTKLNYVCANQDCDGSAYVCPGPDCDGAIVPRTGKYGSFFGCSEYPGCEYSASDKLTLLRDLSGRYQ